MAACIDPPEKLAESAQKWGVSFPLLSDPELKLSGAYGVGYKPPGKGGLPVPAVFLIDRERKIQFQYVNPNYRQRLGRDVMFAAARAMAAP